MVVDLVPDVLLVVRSLRLGRRRTDWFGFCEGDQYATAVAGGGEGGGVLTLTHAVVLHAVVVRPLASDPYNAGTEWGVAEPTQPPAWVLETGYDKSHWAKADYGLSRNPTCSDLVPRDMKNTDNAPSPLMSTPRSG